MEVKMENKNTEIETSLVTLPKMEFVFDSAKIIPAKMLKMNKFLNKIFGFL